MSFGRFFDKIGVKGAVVLLVGVVAACGPTANVTDERFTFSDAKGRHCSHLKFGQFATCDAAPVPTHGCTTGEHACFVVYAGQFESTSSTSTTTPKLVWNCDACCKDGSNAWGTDSTNCSRFVCTTQNDCVSEDGTCQNGQCSTML